MAEITISETDFTALKDSVVVITGSPNFDLHNSMPEHSH